MVKILVVAPNRLNKLPEVHFKFTFNLTGKLTMAFLTDQSWYRLKSNVGGLIYKNKDFCTVLQVD